MLTVGSWGAAGRSSSSVWAGATSPWARSRASRERMRSPSSPAALRVKVTPRTWSGATTPLATSQTTRSTMVAVLPEPAPATTSRGVSGAEITADCWAVGRLPPSSSASSSGLYRGSTPP